MRIPLLVLLASIPNDAIEVGLRGRVRRRANQHSLIRPNDVSQENEPVTRSLDESSIWERDFLPRSRNGRTGTRDLKKDKVRRKRQKHAQYYNIDGGANDISDANHQANFNTEYDGSSAYETIDYEVPNYHQDSTNGEEWEEEPLETGAEPISTLEHVFKTPIYHGRPTESLEEQGPLAEGDTPTTDYVYSTPRYHGRPTNTVSQQSPGPTPPPLFMLQEPLDEDIIPQRPQADSWPKFGTGKEDMVNLATMMPSTSPPPSATLPLTVAPSYAPTASSIPVEVAESPTSTPQSDWLEVSDEPSATPTESSLENSESKNTAVENNDEVSVDTSTLR